MRILKSALAGLLLLGVAGCADQLVVENENSPDRDRALARPSDVENLVSGQFRVIQNEVMNGGSSGGTGTSMLPMLLVMGMESYSSNANWGMNLRGAYPRSAIDNNRGNPTQAEVFNDFRDVQGAARAAALGLSELNKSTFTFFPSDSAQVKRIRSFGYFCLGVAMGYTALAYDSGAVVNPDDDPQANNPLVDYATLMASALANLDTAISLASTAGTGANGFPLPSTWINGNALTVTQFIQLIRSYKARFRAQVARTPAERAQGGLNGLVDWNLIIADAQAGVTSDFRITMANVSGGWGYRPAQMDLYQSWHQMWMFVLGMADTTTSGYGTSGTQGQFDAWLATPENSRLPFNIQTNDLRFPSGTTRAAQNTSSGCGASSCTPPGGTGTGSQNLFFRNRPAGVDVTVQAIANSNYDFFRFQVFFNTTSNGGLNRNGPLPFFPRAELDLLMAEGYLALSQPANAIPLINITRVARGLPAIPAGATTVPGPQCVPRVPTGANGPTACGSLMEAMKWEMRMETAYLLYGGWFMNGRGWGDIPSGTPVHFPVPYQELDARRSALYSTTPLTATSTYGI